MFKSLESTYCCPVELVEVGFWGPAPYLSNGNIYYMSIVQGFIPLKRRMMQLNSLFIFIVLRKNSLVFLSELIKRMEEASSNCCQPTYNNLLQVIVLLVLTCHNKMV